MNNQQIDFEVPTLIDEMSETEYYVGVSINGGNPYANSWKIKRIMKNGNVWSTTYPSADQGFNFIWSDRYSYNYLM